MVSVTLWPLYPQGKNPWYPLDRRLGGPQSHSGHCGEDKNSQIKLCIQQKEACLKKIIKANSIIYNRIQEMMCNS
jgi:hypothetical protein